MLSAPDAELVRRDPAVPGLRLLLDSDALIAELRACLPEAASITDAHIDYVRYKPGTNCLVAYNLDVGGAELHAHGIAYRPDLTDKLDNARKRVRLASPLGAGGVLFEEYATVLHFFPNDGRLKSLRRLSAANDRRELLRELFPRRPALWEARMEGLRYKPRRRYVARLRAENAQLALKLYAKQDYAAALSKADVLNTWQGLKVARLIGHSEGHQALAFEWLPGRVLNELMTAPDMNQDALMFVGQAAARLHGQDSAGLKPLTRDAEVAALVAVAAGIGGICPQLAMRADYLVQRLANRLEQTRSADGSLHGDLYANQVLVMDQDVGFLDFDRACRGDPAADLGNFLGHLERDVLYGRMPADRADVLKIVLLEEYQAASRRGLPAHIDLYTAIGLFRLAPEPFRHHEPDWPARIEAILTRVEAILRMDWLERRQYRSHAP